MSSPSPDLFHAVDGGGNCLPGPQRPFGLVRLGPDMVNHNTSGYASNEDIRHFSHLHVAGTGGQGRYGCIAIVPMGQQPDARTVAFAPSDETARPGYYAVSLHQRQGFGELANAGGIRCELTATRCCGLHRYRWEASLEPWVRIDLGACIGGHSIGGWGRWLNPHVFLARADYRGGWGHDFPYSVFARIEFSHAMEDRFCEGAQLPACSDDAGVGAGLVFVARASNTRELIVRVGISFVSTAQAERHLAKEVGDKSFDAVAAEGSAEWRTLLERFQVSGGSAEDRTLWATFWQRLHAMPGDLGRDEVTAFAAEHRQFNDLYCLWDSVRCANSLFTLVDPAFATDLCTALTEIGEKTGWIPDAWIMGASAAIQGGCSASVLFAEAAAKELPGFDAQRALTALRQTLETPSPDPVIFGRYPEYASMGYLPTPVPNCASRTVEYAYHDACVARLAEQAGEPEIARAYRAQAGRLWENHHPEFHCFAPRDAQGDWVPFDPWRPQRRDFWNDPHFYEGTGHDYALTAWQAIPELIRRRGGPAAFADHLSDYMERCYFWKEINLHVPWLFHFAGRPDLTSRALRKLLDAKITSGRRGLHDNEDMGAWSSAWLTAAMGLFPVPGTPLYLIAAPRFQEIRLALPQGEQPLHIRTAGTAPGPESVIVGATLNGRELTRAWVLHRELASGAHLELNLGSAPRNWGTTPPPDMFAPES